MVDDSKSWLEATASALAREFRLHPSRLKKAIAAALVKLGEDALAARRADRRARAGHLPLQGLLGPARGRVQDRAIPGGRATRCHRKRFDTVTVHSEGTLVCHFCDRRICLWCFALRPVKAGKGVTLVVCCFPACEHRRLS